MINPLKEYMKEWEEKASEEEKKEYENPPDCFKEYPFGDALEEEFNRLSIGEKMLVHYNLEHGDWPVDAHIPEKIGDFHPPNYLAFKLSIFRMIIEFYEIEKEIKEALRISPETLFRTIDY